jgi:predicted MPP superfamily phosphohydrolase
MPLLNEMITRLNTRIAQAQAPYQQLIYFADVHYDSSLDNAGFEKILVKIAAEEKEQTICVLIGGDLVDSGSGQNYTAFSARCNRFFSETGIPIIPTMGNHEFYGVTPKGSELTRYNQYIGNANFPIEISNRGLPDSLTIVAFNDAKPRKPAKVQIPDRSNSCKTITKDYHVFYFRDNYIHLDPKAPDKYSHFTQYLDQSQGNHILVTMHVPPRKNPLPQMLDQFIQREYDACVASNPVISMDDLKMYYRDLWMLVHGNSDWSNYLDSTQMFVDEVKNRRKVELILTGHVHSYYTFPLSEADHRLDVVVSGGGGNHSARSYTPTHPVTKYHYIKVQYDQTLNRFVYSKVDAGN